MTTTTRIALRIAFVALLIVGAACNKMDRNSLQEHAAADTLNGLTPEQAQSAEADRVQALRDRVAYLEAQLKDVHPLSAKANVPGGDYID